MGKFPAWAGKAWATCFPASFLPKKKRKVNLVEAREILEQEEAEKLIDMDEVTQTAIERAEQDSIIFLDEIDKDLREKRPATAPISQGKGVQRDILPYR